MARTEERFDMDNSAVRALKELYLSVFVIFYRVAAGLWPATFNADAHKGVAGLSAVEGLLGLSAFAWLQVLASRRFELNPLIIGAIFLLLYFVNNFFLVSRRAGVEFNTEFNRFSVVKRTLLCAGAIAVVITSLITFGISITAYQGAFSHAK